MLSTKNIYQVLAAILSETFTKHFTIPPTPTPPTTPSNPSPTPPLIITINHGVYDCSYPHFVTYPSVSPTTVEASFSIYPPSSSLPILLLNASLLNTPQVARTSITTYLLPFFTLERNTSLAKTIYTTVGNIAPENGPVLISEISSSMSQFLALDDYLMLYNLARVTQPNANNVKLNHAYLAYPLCVSETTLSSIVINLFTANVIFSYFNFIVNHTSPSQFPSLRKLLLTPPSYYLDVKNVHNTATMFPQSVTKNNQIFPPGSQGQDVISQGNSKTFYERLKEFADEFSPGSDPKTPNSSLVYALNIATIVILVAILLMALGALISWGKEKWWPSMRG